MFDVRRLLLSSCDNVAAKISNFCPQNLLALFTDQYLIVKTSSRKTWRIRLVTLRN